ncbi:MAG: accessory Sec system protein Asp2 [Lachnospiraceae bacterium]|nr:accessory Sec system protein Asp2 [Lachnospiraceae bacterium]
MEEIHILQLGEEDWNKVYTLPEWVQLDHVVHFGEKSEKQKKERTYDLFFLDRTPREEEIDPLFQAVKPHSLFITEKVEADEKTAWLCRCKKAQYLMPAEIQKFLMEETRYYYPKPYGAKFNLRDVSLAQGFSGKVKWNGNHDVTLEGDFGDEFRQVLFWRYNTFLNPGQVIDFWLEYSKDETVSVVLEITQFASGSISEEVAHWTFDEKQLQQVIRLESQSAGSAFLSLCARGKGKLELVALHQRNSRGSHGYFLPGGERYVTSDGQEAFCYFEPGDLKPPLCVYFSGYKTLQGFEGYYMMKGMGCPFLLVAEPRLEGGAFYMGPPEYERQYVDMIHKYMEELGFTADQVVLSGLSMGTYGALYYGCDIRPHAVILGKPLASIGNVAANEKYNRPGGFPTSLDVLMCQNGALDQKAVQGLNTRFWNKFEATDWGNTKFIVSYMIEDDYDADAYQMLISHMQSEGVQIYGKGLHGRHNDNTGGIVNWFLDQYGKVLNEDFGRGKGKK